MDYPLNRLLEWTRRASGDRARKVRDTFVTTGESAFVLTNDGGITLMSSSADGEAVDINTLTLDGNTVTFATAPADGSDLAIAYAVTKYTDAELLDFLADAAVAVASDIHADWSVVRTSYKIMNVVAPYFDLAINDLAFNAQACLVYKAAVDIFGDRTNQAAGKAILVKNGDTTVDTSKTAVSGEKAMVRLQKRYDDAVKQYKIDLFRGTGQINNVAVDHYRPLYPAAPFQTQGIVI